jgi:hypothetical protein
MMSIVQIRETMGSNPDVEIGYSKRHHERNDVTPALYSGGPESKSRLGDLLS